MVVTTIMASTTAMEEPMNRTAASPKKLKAKVVEATVDEPTVLVLRVSRRDGTSHSKLVKVSP